MKIAVSGKGGAGKSTIAANLVHCFAAANMPVYAVDADPDANLGLVLGLDPVKLGALQPLIELQEVIAAKNAGGGTLVDLNPDVADVLERYVLREGAIRFLKMGGIKQGGSSCYCKENAFLNAVLTNILLDRPEAVVLDMSAGIEHLTRGTARGIGLMMVVVEPVRSGVATALAVERLAGDLAVPRTLFIGNKIRSAGDRAFLLSALPEERVVGMIPFSEKVLERAQRMDITGFRPDDFLPGMDIIYQKITGGG